MSKYTEISSKAVDYAVAFMAQRTSCEHLAMVTRVRLRDHLEAPDRALQFVELTDELETVWAPIEAPKLVQGRDGFWYFGILVSFTLPGSPAYSKLALKFGARALPDHAELKLDSTYRIHADEESSWAALLSELSNELVLHYSRGPSDPPRSIGFIAGS